jgi:hypothetical protein
MSQPTALGLSRGDLVDAIDRERRSILGPYDPSRTAEHSGSPPGSLEPDLDAYLNRLRNFTTDYFEGAAIQPSLLAMLEHLEGRFAPPLTSDPIPKRLVSTDKNGLSGLPETFDSWRKRLGGDWEVVVEADKPSEWFDEVLGNGRLRRAYEALPNIVMKMDFLR